MRRLHWIIWLMLALLPLRGWAHGFMLVQAAQGSTTALPTVAAAAHHEASNPDSLPPCHQPMVGAQSDAGESSATASHACALCDLCHGVLAPPVAGGTLAHALPGDVPAVHLAIHAARGVTTLIYRPPRTQHA